MWASLRVKNSRGQSHKGESAMLLYFSPRVPPSFHSKYRRKKIPSRFQQEEGKRNKCEICQIILFFLTKTDIRENWLIRA